MIQSMEAIFIKETKMIEKEKRRPKPGYRVEEDAMGTVEVPETAYYGAQTARAADNFPISGLRFPGIFTRSLALIKKHAAIANHSLGQIDAAIADAVVVAATEIMDGRFADQFIIDIFQTGSGTSTNMNMNEVIASRANEKISGRKGGKHPVHPNDHVNKGQSSNDVIPSTLHISAWLQIDNRLIPALRRLHEALEKKAMAFADIRKIGRTHLQDAVPMTLGDEFSGYARQIELGIERMETVGKRLAELALGGTAIGTGLNAPSGFAEKVISGIATETGLPFVEAKNHFEAQSAQDAAVEVSGMLKTLATSLYKIANDIRWLASGPRCGIGEIELPSLQPGSSIMPGKVNPVICESVIQVAAQVVGNDAAVTLGGQGGFFELNTMLPIIAYNLLQSIDILTSSATVFADKCVAGILANRKKSESYIENSLALATHLIPYIGYDAAAIIAKKAYESGKTIREIAETDRILPQNMLDTIFPT